MHGMSIISVGTAACKVTLRAITTPNWTSPIDVQVTCGAPYVESIWEQLPVKLRSETKFSLYVVRYLHVSISTYEIEARIILRTF